MRSLVHASANHAAFGLLNSKYLTRFSKLVEQVRGWLVDHLEEHDARALVVGFPLLAGSPSRPQVEATSGASALHISCQD
eukprot:1191020-Prorocentrum_minimum.AAC.2